MWIIYQGGLFKHLLFQRRHTCVCLRENLAAPLKDMPGVFMVQWAERQIMQRHIFHPACWIEWQWARGCDLHTPLHSGWYFLMVLGRVNHLQQQQQHHHPLYPQPSSERQAETRRPLSVPKLCVFGGARIQHTSSADRLAIVGLCSSGSYGGDIIRRWRLTDSTLFPRGSSPGWNVRSSKTHTHLYCIQGWRLCVGFDWDTSKSFKGYAVYTNCIVGYKIPPKKREKG